ncbi:MAG: hypothetical protein WBJ13_12115 [Sedimentibacter sp.]
MRIGIKYCGGCNPMFDRSKLVQKIKDEYKGFLFETANEKEMYDILIIVNGCLRACSNHDDIRTKLKLFINNEKNYEDIKKVLDENSNL